MNDKPLPPPNEAAIFEAGYMASTLRARREFTWAQRAAVMRVLSGAAPDKRIAAAEDSQSGLRSFALILARCESAATLLGWRKQISPEQKGRLDGAVRRLNEATTEVRVCASVHPAATRPDRQVRFVRDLKQFNF